MYQSEYNPNYIIPALLKYQCLDEDCEKEFILSDAYDNTNVHCPYCGNQFVEAIALMDDPNRLDDLGCMAISTDEEWLEKVKRNINFAFKWIHTPKCKDCTPTSHMLKRRSCAGCTKFLYRNRVYDR